MDEHAPVFEPFKQPDVTAFTDTEIAGIERGLADIAAGRVYRFETVMAWLEKLDTDPDAAMPPYD